MSFYHSASDTGPTINRQGVVRGSGRNIFQIRLSFQLKQLILSTQFFPGGEPTDPPQPLLPPPPNPNIPGGNPVDHTIFVQN